MSNEISNRSGIKPAQYVELHGKIFTAVKTDSCIISSTVNITPHEIQQLVWNLSNAKVLDVTPPGEDTSKVKYFLKDHDFDGQMISILIEGKIINEVLDVLAVDLKVNLPQLLSRILIGDSK